MRICYVAESVVPSRTANSLHVMKMCQAYARNGNDVTLIVPRWREGVEPEIEDVYGFYGVERTFRIRRVPISRLRVSTIYWGFLLPFVARTLRPDIVHTRSLGVAWGTAAIFRTPTLYEVHAPPPENGRSARFFRRAVNSPHMKAVVCITHALAKQVAGSVPESLPVVVAPDGVDRNLLKNPLSREAARAALGLSRESSRIVVYSGSLYRGRGIELIHRLAVTRQDHLFLVVGGGDPERERLCRRLRPLPNMRIVGFVPPASVPPYLFAADVLLLPHQNRVEAAGGSEITDYCSPIKMFEYMASGRPMLASNLPVLQEVLRDGVNSILLPYDRPELWADALDFLAKNPNRAAALAKKAREEAAHYTWENRAERIQSLVTRFMPKGERLLCF